MPVLWKSKMEVLIVMLTNSKKGTERKRLGRIILFAKSLFTKRTIGDKSISASKFCRLKIPVPSLCIENKKSLSPSAIVVNLRKASLLA